VQLSADSVPFVIHDVLLDRTTTRSGDLRRLEAAELDRVDAGEPRRFGAAHRGTRLPRLTALATLLARHPGPRAFIELKRASLHHHGHARCIDAVIEALGGAGERCALISFDFEAISEARRRTRLPTGWVLERFTPDELDRLAALAPDFAFCDYLKIPAGVDALPSGPWRWAVYEVKTAARARAERSRGAALVETMAPLRLQAALAAGTDA